MIILRLGPPGAGFHGRGWVHVCVLPHGFKGQNDWGGGGGGGILPVSGGGWPGLDLRGEFDRCLRFFGGFDWLLEGNLIRFLRGC